MTDRSYSKKIKAVTEVIASRHKAVWKKPVTSTQKKDLVFSLEEAYVRDRLVMKLYPNGKLAWFFQFKPTFMGEFEEVFFHIQYSYCVDDPKVRREFYRAIEKSFYELQCFEKIKRLVIEVAFDDEESKRYFSKRGFLTYIELLGSTSDGLKGLNTLEAKKSRFKVSKIRKSEVNQLIKLDLQAHQLDKTSRMRKIFSKPNAKKNMQQFYNGLQKHGLCFVARDGKKPVGDIGVFFDKKNGLGLIACIFVAHQYKNKGISKLLYRAALTEFKKRKYKNYLGATTTSGVLNVASKIGRIPTKYAYIVKM